MSKLRTKIITALILTVLAVEPGIAQAFTVLTDNTQLTNPAVTAPVVQAEQQGTLLQNGATMNGANMQLPNPAVMGPVTTEATYTGGNVRLPNPATRESNTPAATYTGGNVQISNPAVKGPVTNNPAYTGDNVQLPNPAVKGPVTYDYSYNDTPTITYNRPKISSCGRAYPKDIDGHWAEIYIRRLFDLCVLEGYSDSRFRPNQNITRAELTKMALSGSKIEPNRGCYDNDCGSPFTDLDKWQGQWVRTAWDRGIVRGYNNDRFRPNYAITRAEAVKIVLAAYGQSPDNNDKSFFNDVSGWSTGWIERAHNIGIVQGIGNGNFDPDRAITRAEASKIIAKMIEYSDTRIR